MELNEQSLFLIISICYIICEERFMDRDNRATDKGTMN